MTGNRAKVHSMRGFKLAFLAILLAAAPATAQDRGHETAKVEPQTWSFSGPLGGFDKAQLQRGFKTFQTVCSNCHSMNYVSFRNLGEPGGPGFSAGQVKALAASYETIKDGPNDAGDMFKRKGLPSDRIPWNFDNAAAAKAALNAVPPDMSVLAKARSYGRPFPAFIFDAFTQYEEKGPDYIVALLTKGYVEAPAEIAKEMPAGVYYNAVMPGGKIAMANPLDLMFDAAGKPSDAQYYTDGTPMTREQVARDVAAFLMWAAEPKLEERKRTGFKVMIFLVLFAGLLYMVKRRVWAGLHDAH